MHSHTKMDSVFFVVTFLTFVTLVECQGNVVHFNIPKSKFGLKLVNSLIETKYDIHILASCARECFYVTKCKSFSYNRMGGMCLLNSLNSTEADVADFVEDGKYIYSDLTDWKKKMVYTCGEKPCALNEKCIPYRSHKCTAYCGIPKSVTNAEVDIGEVHEGSIRNYTCIAPNVPTSSDTSVTCQSNSEWTAVNFQCTESSLCEDSNVWSHNGVLWRHKGENTGSMCVTHCYQEHSYCGPPPNITNAVVGPGEETENATRKYTCREHYIASTNLTSITCQQSTYWSSPDFNCLPYCGNPNNVTNAVVDNGGVVEGSVRNFTCIATHVPSSPYTSVTCQSNFEWTAPNFKCLAYCGNPNNVTNAVVDNGGVVEGSVRNFTCIAPHVPSSPYTSVTCQSNFEWTAPNFKCLADCGPPPTVVNADIGSGATSENATRTYTCREPYTASTSKMSITCQQSTYWSSPEFSCQLITTCQEARNCNPSNGDGEYWLVLDNFDTTRRMKIRCNNMSGTPYETLTVPYNWRTWYDPPIGFYRNGYYSDIAIDVKTLRLSEAMTETGTDHCMIGYGTITSHATCYMTRYQLNFFLDGTGFRFSPVPTWVFKSGYAQPISVDNQPSKRLDVSGAIYLNYGYVTYSAPFTLRIDENDVVPVSRAKIPRCP